MIIECTLFEAIHLRQAVQILELAEANGKMNNQRLTVKSIKLHHAASSKELQN